jgi:hypothetical protein
VAHTVENVVIEEPDRAFSSPSIRRRSFSPALVAGLKDTSCADLAFQVYWHINDNHSHYCGRTMRVADNRKIKRQAAEPRMEEAQRIPAGEHRFLLQVVQPGLVGLMDGSVSTLAPIFASAYVTRNPRDAFLVGMAAAVGAAISMGFAEGLSDDGSITGRGNPLTRGLIVAFATFVGGSLHTLPFLSPSLRSALILAYLVVAIELLAIATIRFRYLHMSFARSIIQVVLGGALVFAAGYLIGNA